jgi:hypothetical protein
MRNMAEWELAHGHGNTTDLVNDYPFVTANMPVWDSVESIRAFTYRSGEHTRILRERSIWFQKMDLPHEQFGPTPHAFWFARTFEAAIGKALLSCQ